MVTLEVFRKPVLSISAKDAGRLTKVWPRRFPTIAAAQPLARNRDGSDDGWHFRGRGPKQLTGRNNYTAFEAWLNTGANDPTRMPVSADLVTLKINGGRIGCAERWDWTQRGSRP